MATLHIKIVKKEDMPRINETIKNDLLKYGWQHKGTCNCGGSNTNKFELKTPIGDYQLRLRYSSFSISKPGINFTKHPISELKQIIDEIHSNNKATV